MEWIPIVVIAVLALIVVISNIHIVQQSRAYVIERSARSARSGRSACTSKSRSLSAWPRRSA